VDSYATTVVNGSVHEKDVLYDPATGKTVTFNSVYRVEYVDESEFLIGPVILVFDGSRVVACQSLPSVTRSWGRVMSMNDTFTALTGR
jgi:hypothetical protein